MAAEEQDDFVALLRDLRPEQWDQPSWCDGWSVHDVVVHAANHTHASSFDLIVQGARPNSRAARRLHAAHGLMHTELVEWLASPARLAPGLLRVQLAELLIHHQDVRRPLGLARRIPEHRLLTVLESSLTRAGSVGIASGRKRAAGLRLQPTDLEWSAGHGPEVRGPGEAILMAVNGRRAALADLEGDGVATLSARVPTELVSGQG